jgi:phosphatidylserine/phosphatidylglycerophosphate/cardiolipin synthase-like enzyme/uncharacterized membrane protein YdjX (TVP38/TMEM64 family)
MGKYQDTILQLGETCGRMAYAETSGVLVDGEQYYTALDRVFDSAESYILLSTWQFDTRTRLLRDKEGTPTFLERLIQLLDERKNLEVYILAWDYSVLFQFEREWFSRLKVELAGHPRLHFQFDEVHPVGGSHHYKITVVDGRIAFVGGLDLCEDRWDTRAHKYRDPRRRNYNGNTYRPFHDVVAFVTGRAARAVEREFCYHWKWATGQKLWLKQPGSGRSLPDFQTVSSLSGVRVGIARTLPPMLFPPQSARRDIQHLYQKAILSAKRSIYMENPYFTSRAVLKALQERLAQVNSSQDPLEIVVVLPQLPSGLVESLTILHHQLSCLKNLAEACRKAGIQYGFFYPVTVSPEGSEQFIYTHANILAVDDKLLTVGSANTSNRSMGYDTECNLVWEAHENFGDANSIAQFIQQTRDELMAEYCGVPIQAWREELHRHQGRLVDTLENLKNRGIEKKLIPLRGEDIQDSCEATLEFLPETSAMAPSDPFWINPGIMEDLKETWEILQGNSLTYSDSEKSKEPEELPEAEFKRISLLRILGLTGGLIGLVVLVRSFLPEDLTIHNLLVFLNHLRQQENAPWLFAGLFLLATQAFVSVTVMVIVTALILGVKKGLIVNIGGVMVSALLGYLWGRLVGPKSLKQLLPGWISRHIDRVSKLSPWSVAFFRIVPIMPYQIFNLIAGAAGLRLRSYVLGTLMGDLPATFLITWSVGNLQTANWQEGIPWYTLLLAIGITGLLTLSGYILSRRLKQSASLD